MESGGVGLDGAAVRGIAAIVVLSLLMVAAMVRLSRAFLARVEREARPGVPRGAGPEDSPIRRWGSVYGLVWLALIAAFLWLMWLLEGGWSRRNLAILALVVGSYWAVHATLLWFAAALIRANLRDARAEPPPAGSRPYGGDWSGEAAPEAESSRVSGAARASAGARRTASVPAAAAPSAADRLRSFGRLLAMLAVVFVFVAIGAAVPALREMEAWFDLHRRPLAAAVGAVAGVGWALFMGATIHGVLTAGRGGSFSDTMSFREVKAAFRARAWRTSRRWRRFLVMAAGAALMTVGLFGLGIVFAPAGLKLLCAAAIVYVAVQTVRGFRRT